MKLKKITIPKFGVKEKILTNPAKTEAMLLLQRGYSWRYVAKETQLSIGTIKYWAGLINVKPTDFREGRSEFSKKLRVETKVFTMNFLQSYLKRLKN